MKRGTPSARTMMESSLLHCADCKVETISSPGTDSDQWSWESGPVRKDRLPRISATSSGKASKSMQPENIVYQVRAPTRVDHACQRLAHSSQTISKDASTRTY